MSTDLACPAAAVVHPVLSPNKDDIQCGVAGHLRPAEDSPCCEALGPHGYTWCQLWRLARDLERMHMGRKIDAVRKPKEHVLSGVQRDTVRV